jgi:hypothetical protein
VGEKSHTGAAAAGPAGPGDLTDLTLELKARSEGGKITSPAMFVVTIQNQSDKKYRVEEIELAPPVAFRDVQSPKQPWKFECLYPNLEARGALRCDLRTESVKPTEIRRLFSAGTVFFLPDDYPVVATVKYREDLPNKPELSEWVETKLALAPSLASLMTGGVMGAFLLVLFLGAHRSCQVLQAEGLGLLTWRRGLLFALRLGAQALFGSIVAVIAIVLIERVADFELPIRIQIKDFLGGILVGLFSTKLGETLHKQFLA